MKTLELNINLPDDLMLKAQNAGLLTSEAIESMLREQLRKQAAATLNAIWANSPNEVLTPEIESEIVAQVRQVRRNRHKELVDQ